jgi:hypothetical protein
MTGTHRALAAALVLAAVLTEAAPAAVAAQVADPEQRNSFVYEPPNRRPQDTRPQQLAAPADWLLERMAEHLRELGMQVERTGPGDHILVHSIPATRGSSSTAALCA